MAGMPMWGGACIPSCCGTAGGGTGTGTGGTGTPGIGTGGLGCACGCDGAGFGPETVAALLEASVD